MTQKQKIQNYLYYNYPATPTTIANWTGIPAPSARRVLREMEDAGIAKWIAGDISRNGVSGYVRV
jgi:DNA-binding Lrp family transcriptional regulator